MITASKITVCGQPIPDAAELALWRTWELGRLRSAVSHASEAMNRARNDTTLPGRLHRQYGRLLRDIDRELASRGVAVPSSSSPKPGPPRNRRSTTPTDQRPHRAPSRRLPV